MTNMALNQTNKLVWIVETIYRAHRISFEELNRRWMDNVDLSGGEEMLKRTFRCNMWMLLIVKLLSFKRYNYPFYKCRENEQQM